MAFYTGTTFTFGDVNIAFGSVTSGELASSGVTARRMKLRSWIITEGPMATIATVSRYLRRLILAHVFPEDYRRSGFKPTPG
jgi:hypothetical protein